MKTIPKEFESILLGELSESDCSPKIDSWGFRGIKLNAPKKVIVNSEFILPLCGSTQFSEKFINEFKRIDDEIVIVVVNTLTNQSYSGNLSEPSYESEENIKSIGTDEELELNTVNGWFNIDVYDYVRSLTQLEGTYLIYALIGDLKSNVVSVEIEISEGAVPGPREPRPN
ncbi:MAG: hypothetical protein QM503_12225 [Bacteroidota bacterium]